VRALVVYCHPCEESYGAALRDTTLETLRASGHEVRLIDLYADNFQPVLSAEERRVYNDKDLNERTVAEDIAHIQWCEILILVYPTWWYGMPAMMKGWFDRVWVPHVTFVMPTADTGIRPNMQNIRKIGVITTCGATWWISKLIGEPGRKTILRGVRALCHRRCKTLYLALYKMDTVTATQRQKFLATVARRLAKI